MLFSLLNGGCYYLDFFLLLFLSEKGLEGLGSKLDVTEARDNFGVLYEIFDPFGDMLRGLSETRIKCGLKEGNNLDCDGDISDGDSLTNEVGFTIEVSVKHHNSLLHILDGVIVNFSIDSRVSKDCAQYSIEV